MLGLLNADTKELLGAPLLAVFEKWPVRAANTLVTYILDSLLSLEDNHNHTLLAH